MIRKWSIFFLFISVVVFSEKTRPLGFVSFKPSYFYPQDKNFRRLYNGGYLTLAELGFVLNKRGFLSMEAGCFHKNERISGIDLHLDSSVMVVPLSLYLGYIVAKGSFWDLYAKAGPNLVYGKTDISIPGLPNVEHKWTFGGSFGCGSKFYFPDGVFIEVFLNYLYDKKKIHDSGDHFSVYVGGLQAGGGLGYRF